MTNCIKTFVVQTCSHVCVGKVTRVLEAGARFGTTKTCWPRGTPRFQKVTNM